jgi:uncharacterized hydrophobic protein (TIGR00271 family)
MSVLALVTKPEEAGPVVTWAAQLAAARDTTLTVLCWASSPTVLYPLLMDKEAMAATDDLVAAVETCISPLPGGDPTNELRLSKDKITIRRLLHPDAVAATLEQIRSEDAELVVAAADDASGEWGATYASNALLRQSPCHTVILYCGGGRSPSGQRVMVGTSDSPHDSVAVALAAQLVKKCGVTATMARVEEGGEEAIEVGRRELRQLMRAAGVKRHDRIRHRVFLANNPKKVAAAAEKHDLFIIGANNQPAVEKLLAMTSHPTIAVFKQAPPLRPWHRRRNGIKWRPRLSPADYADLVQGLRRGSRLNVDFITMLGLAAAIASFGLLQDSPAVVIGSMLLAPLMTPMIGSGLALAQANARLGRSSLASILVGSLLTLAVSYLVGIVTPGQELTAQVMARGTPNLLDLSVALFSAAAAAYALARPSIVGAVAGVAIATALVPPLCSIGISVAYDDIRNAQGAALLFTTNLVAIVLGAAVTFRLLGVSATRADLTDRRWVYRISGGLGIVAIALAFPLERALERNIELGKPQPSTYPLTKAVEDALAKHIAQDPDVHIVATGRPSSSHDQADVVVVISSPEWLPRTYATSIIDLVRRELHDDNVVVEVHCLREGWQQDEEPRQEEENSRAGNGDG